MTPAQWTVLRAMALPTGENRGSAIHPKTLLALIGCGYIEQAPRMYFGPREERYRLTALGREAIAKSDARRSANPLSAREKP